MENRNYTCPKCGWRKAEIDNIRTTGAGFTRFFDIQNRKFIAVSCEKCGFTEFYKAGRSGAGSNILDFITN
jgi:predicted nucleic-acid-binding Zn-ribbon protein